LPSRKHMHVREEMPMASYRSMWLEVTPPETYGLGVS